MILPLMSLLTNLHHKVPALICENTKSTTLCSRDGERMISEESTVSTAFEVISEAK